MVRLDLSGGGAHSDGVVAAGVSRGWGIGRLADAGTALAAITFWFDAIEPHDTVWVLDRALAQGSGSSVGPGFVRDVPNSPCHKRRHTFNLRPRTAR